MDITHLFLVNRGSVVGSVEQAAVHDLLDGLLCREEAELVFLEDLNRGAHRELLVTHRPTQGAITHSASCSLPETFGLPHLLDVLDGDGREVLDQVGHCQCLIVCRGKLRVLLLRLALVLIRLGHQLQVVRHLLHRHHGACHKMKEPQEERKIRVAGSQVRWGELKP